MRRSHFTLLFVALLGTVACKQEAPPEVSLSIAWQPVVQLEAKVDGEGPFVYHWSVDGLERPDLLTNTVAPATGAAQVMGTSTTLTASSDSGLTVTLASTTPGVCTVSGTTLTPVAAGNCTITANQAGNSTFAAAATVTRMVTVTNPAAVTSAANGKTLYASNNCGMCHGTPPATMNVLNGANNPTLIRSAINNPGIGGMNGYSSLTDQNLADIAAYLATPGI